MVATSGVIDITSLLDSEEGTALDMHTALFGNYGDGQVFWLDQGKVDEMEEMLDRDGKARSLEACLTLPLRQASYSIQPARAKTKVTDFIIKALTYPANGGGMSTPMNTVIAQMTQAMVHRRTFFEKCWTVRDGKFVYDKLAWRPPGTCSIVRDEQSGAFQGFKQQPYRITNNQQDNQVIFFKPERAFVYIHGTHRNPMNGISDLNIAYWCYQTKQKIRFLWYSFLEGQSLPKTLVRADSIGQAKKGAKAVQGLRQGGIAAIERNIDVDAFESSGKGAAQFKEAMQWLDAEASGSVLAGFTDLGAQAAGGTGSFALSKDQTDFFLMSRQAVAREMADAINQYVIPDLVKYNFGPDEAYPCFEFAPIAQDEAAASITLLQAIATVPDSNVPREFMAELIERVAGFLEMDTTKVREGLERIYKEAEDRAAMAPIPPAPGVAGVGAAVDAATEAVQYGQPAGDNPTGAASPRPLAIAK